MDSPCSDISISIGGSLVFEDSEKDLTPSSTYSAPYPSAAMCQLPCQRDPTSDDRIIKSANSSSSDCGPVSQQPNVSVPSTNPPVRLFLSLSPSIPCLLKSSVSLAVPSSPICVTE